MKPINYDIIITINMLIGMRTGLTWPTQPQDPAGFSQRGFFCTNAAESLGPRCWPAW